MQELADQMQQLRKDFAAARNLQRERLGTIREDVHQIGEAVEDLLHTFRDERIGAANELQAQRREYLNELQQEVKALSSRVAASLQTYRDARVEAAQTNRADRAEAVREAQAFVENLRVEVRDFMKDMEGERSQRKEAAANARRAFLSGVRVSVRTLLAEARTARHHQHTASRPADTKQSSAPSRSTEPSASSAASATSQDSSSTADDATAPGGAQATASESAAAPSATEDTASSNPSAASSADPKDTSGSTRHEESSSSRTFDNLAAIKGIGPKMAFRLRQAGVVTFDDLADLTPEDLRELMDGLPSFADVESWIEQAKLEVRKQS
ncbi:helix-hairpin-helix domain-containing protein [Salisaeta longa]|uniref:helix-hairpin-helix domain-containing protein n=1 Tax=Salisaeta longa TaxID=503170 RepID=UPI0003B5993F|nr:helix-hairpin-helix domain-containing protein [Salisaeta longa]